MFRIYFEEDEVLPKVPKPYFLRKPSGDVCRPCKGSGVIKIFGEKVKCGGCGGSGQRGKK